jgi:acetyl-CoA carboxylase biotin carboxyl carrier protein
VALTDEDVREILRIIDESDLDELRIDTGEFKLHVRRGGTPPEEEAEEEEASPTPPAAGARAIEAPMLGIFHRAEAPGATPFVDVGAHVDPDTVVCIMEVMKMMNSVPAGLAGTIVEVCADNAEVVEEGQALFRVAPEA